MKEQLENIEELMNGSDGHCPTMQCEALYSIAISAKRRADATDSIVELMREIIRRLDTGVE
jgi:hypothetical protein